MKAQSNLMATSNINAACAIVADTESSRTKRETDITKCLESVILKLKLNIIIIIEGSKEFFCNDAEVESNPSHNCRNRKKLKLLIKFPIQTNKNNNY